MLFPSGLRFSRPVPSGGAETHAQYTRVGHPRCPKACISLTPRRGGTRSPETEAWLSEKSKGGRAPRKGAAQVRQTRRDPACGAQRAPPAGP